MRLPSSALLAGIAIVTPFLVAPVGTGRVAAAPSLLPPPCRLLIAPVGGADYDRFGGSVAGAGDVNGDGYADVVVGAYEAVYNEGRAYVFYGGPGADDVPDLTLSGSGIVGSAFGARVAGVGDLNGDGYDDVAVGDGAGAVFVFYGGHPADEFKDLTLASPQLRDQFGTALAGGGDVNGDGYDDLIVGAYAGDSRRGRAYLYFGGPQTDGSPDLVFVGDQTYGGLGAAVAAAGDVNGDGFSDVMIGAPGLSPDPGHAYLYYGGPGMDNVPDLTLTGDASYAPFGVAVSGAHDVNGDGSDDVIVGARGFSSGRAYVYYGGAGNDTIPDLTFTGSGGWDLFGFSVAGPGDVNGDGFADLLVGAAWDSSVGTFAGRAFVYYGGPAADTVADLTLSGEAESFFGQSLRGAGDFDGDGSPDLIIGAWHWVESPTRSPGRAYVISTHPAPLTANVEIDPRTINLKRHAPWVTAYIEPSGFDPATIDVSSLRLVGSIPAASKLAIVGDRDGNGLPDLAVKFSREPLDLLLTPGMNELELTGSLVTGEKFTGVDTVRVIAPGGGRPAAQLRPNPLSPSALLQVETHEPGPLRVMLFDLHGRLVRTVLDVSLSPAGVHGVRLDGDGGHGGRLGSGVYFLRIRTAEGDLTERLMVVK
jgi:hypothetical protein